MAVIDIKPQNVVKTMDVAMILRPRKKNAKLAKAMKKLRRLLEQQKRMGEDDKHIKEQGQPVS